MAAATLIAALILAGAVAWLAWELRGAARMLRAHDSSIHELADELRMNRADEWSLPRVLERNLTAMSEEIHAGRLAAEALDKRFAPALEAAEALVSALRKKQEIRIP